MYKDCDVMGVKKDIISKIKVIVKLLIDGKIIKK